MFATATPFLPQYSACMNNTSSNFFAFQNDKENYNPFTQNKSQHQRQFSRQESRPFTSQPLSQINPFAQVQLATQQECSAMFGGNFAKKTQVSDNNCLHQSTKKYKRTFCKDCGIFIPSSGAEAYTEQVFKTKMDSHPDEVIAIMLKNQHKNREYLQNSTHIKYRQPLVEWISNIGEELHFFCDTIYTAISYLDTILLKVEIPKNKLQLLCICSLIAAAKFCEKEEKVPSYREVFERCQGIYSIDLLKKTESFVLESLEWNLKTVTPFQFIEFYLSKGCTFASDRSLIRKIDPKLLRYLRKYAEFFVDSAVQNYDFNSYDSNIIACASICAARKAVGLMPLWTAELEELTEVSWEQIEVCFTLLYSSFEVAYPEIAQKANSFIEQAQLQAKNEVAELEKSYAAMTIENRNGTPSFKGSSWRESPKSDESEPKMERPETADEERRSCRMEWNMAEQARDAFNQEKLRMLEMKMKENRMNIENAGQGFSGAAGKIKRNLIF